MSCLPLRSTHRVTYSRAASQCISRWARSSGKSLMAGQVNTKKSVPFDCLTLGKAVPIIAEQTGDNSWHVSVEGTQVMPTAVEMEVSPETIIRAVKRMRKSTRQVFFGRSHRGDLPRVPSKHSRSMARF